MPTRSNPNASPYVSRADWDARVKGWSIVDCAVRSKNFVQFVLRKFNEDGSPHGGWDSEIPTRAFQIKLGRSESESRVGSQDIFRMGHPKVGVSLQPVEQGLVFSADQYGHVIASGSGHQGTESITPEKESPGLERIVCIQGWAYAVGMFRQVYKRVAIGRWERLPTQGLVTTASDAETLRWMGFADMDGPDERCLYAVGGKGDVFLFDGEKWRQCDFPSNEQLGTVTVAPNGDVYITGEAGNIWLGKEDTWELIHRGTSSLLNRDSVWFNDMLWVSSDYQTRVVKDGVVSPVMHKGEPQWLAGHMDARDGILVIAGQKHARLFDGTDWHWLIQPYEDE